MNPKILVLIIIPLSNFVGYTGLVYAEKINAPTVNCIGLPGCMDTNKSKPTPYKPKTLEESLTIKWITSVISEAIQYISVIAVITLMLSGIMYMVSGGEDEKIKKAKTWIIWSLIGVFLSLLAWGIINILNTFNIT